MECTHFERNFTVMMGQPYVGISPRSQTLVEMLPLISDELTMVRC
jgi:hypothetical protein